MSKKLPTLLKRGDWFRGTKPFKSNGKDYLALTPEEIKHFRKFRIVLDDPLTPRTGPIKQKTPEVEEYSEEPVGKLEELGSEEPETDTSIAALKTRFMTRPYKSLDSFAEALELPSDYIWEIGRSWPAEKAAKRAAKGKK